MVHPLRSRRIRHDPARGGPASWADLPPLISGQACVQIGNIEGEGPVTCRGPAGRDCGKAGGAFAQGGGDRSESYTDDVWILLRFRGLERRRHLMRVTCGPRRPPL
jgi:hypothetical protein